LRRLLAGIVTLAMAATTLVAGATTAAASTGPACADVPASGLRDVDDTVHRDGIECIVRWRVAGGYADGRFRPSQLVDRAQMATFVANAVATTGTVLPEPQVTFPDVGGVHSGAIHRLATAGIVNGRTDGTYGPALRITRGQMAVFLRGAAEYVLDEALTGAEPAVFTDIDGHVHQGAIEAVAAAGIARGGTDGSYRPDDPVTRGQLGTFVAYLLEVFVAAGVELRPVVGVDEAALTAQVCPTNSADLDRSSRLMAGYYQWAPHPEVHLGTALTWREDPFDPNWRFQFHSLRWLWPLLSTTHKTGDVRYRDHAVAMARDWVASNPVNRPADPMAWNDHSAAWRALVLTCMARTLPTPPAWLTGALDLHRRMLADPAFYVDVGNHALNQDIGLLAISCATGASADRDLATQRIQRLLLESVDAQGVTNEQAVGYQHYNYERYVAASRMLTACGQQAHAIVDRVAAMPVVLAHLTLPNGYYETLGNTDRQRVAAFDHPALRWLRSGGEYGTPPAQTFVHYQAGFAAARTGWGHDRPLPEEGMLTARYGPRPSMHGHDDHGSITLYGHGQRLVVDPGKYAYVNDASRVYVNSRRAHNVVTVGSETCHVPDQPSRIADVASDAEVDRFRLHVRTCQGMTWERAVAFVRATGEVVVVDDITAPSGTPVHQRWQLEVGASVDTSDVARVGASWASGAALLIEQLGAVSDVTSVAGERTPFRGWVSQRYGDLTAAPNLLYAAPAYAGGTVTRFVTVLRPSADAAAPASTIAGSAGGPVTVRVPTASGGTVSIVFPPA